MSNNRQRNSRIALNTLLLTMRMLIVMAIGLYSTRVVLQVLGVFDYGLYNVVGGFVSMFAFLNTSMSNGIQRFYNFELGIHGENTLSNVYSTASRIQIIIVVVVLFFTETVGLWYLYNKMVISEDRFNAAFYCFQFSVISLIFSILQLPYMALVMARERMNFYAIVSVLDAILKLIIVLFLPIINYDHLISYGFLLMLITFVDLILYYGYVKYKFPNDIQLVKNDSELFKKMLSFSGWNCFGSFGGVVSIQGLNLILNLFFGTAVNAARGIAFQISSACKSFVFNITTASRPQMTQSYAEGNIRRSVDIMESISKFCFFSVLILALPVITEIDFLLFLWLGNNIPIYTKIFTVLIVAESLISVFNPPVSFMVHATGKMRNYQLITTIVSLLSLPIAYFLLNLGNEPYFVFLASIGVTTVCQIVSVILLKTLIDIRILEYIRKVIIPMLLVVITSCIIPFIAHSFMPIGWLRLIIVVFLSFISVIISSLYLGLSHSERSVVFALIPMKKVHAMFRNPKMN